MNNTPPPPPAKTKTLLVQWLTILGLGGLAVFLGLLHLFFRQPPTSEPAVTDAPAALTAVMPAPDTPEPAAAEAVVEEPDGVTFELAGDQPEATAETTTLAAPAAAASVTDIVKKPRGPDDPANLGFVPAPIAADLITPPDIVQDWGIQVTGLHLAINGNMLNLRYTVQDPVKAAELFKRVNQPSYLIDESNGTKIALAPASRSGSLRRDSQQLHKDRTYQLFFPNPGQQFKSGSIITLAMGDFKLEHLTVK